MMNNKTILELTGQTSEHLVFNSNLNVHIHHQINSDLDKLQSKLQECGHELKVISSFRSFDHQLRIWEEKVNGVRPVLDSNENQLDINNLKSDELLFAILNWSMIPGFSRHHLGTDLDVIDSKNLSDNYQVKLLNSEFEKDGPFYKFNETLDDLIRNDTAFGFYRPYLKQGLGVKPEKWHISHLEVSNQYLENLTIDLFEEVIMGLNISLKEEIINYLELIYKEYIRPKV